MTSVKPLVTHVIQRTPLYNPLRNWVTRRRHTKELVEWERIGRPVPPPHLVKQRMLRDRRQFNLRILIETGTYLGDMVEAMKRDFDEILSISPQTLYERARRRFEGVSHVHIIQGDSARELGRLTKTLTRPALFWLDGHYSAGVTAKAQQDTPILEELSHIFSSECRGHVIVIDDARLFGTDPAYPSVDDVGRFVRARREDVQIVVQDDSIRITPSGWDGDDRLHPTTRNPAVAK